jgi:hypothetical protein
VYTNHDAGSYDFQLWQIQTVLEQNYWIRDMGGDQYDAKRA